MNKYQIIANEFFKDRYGRRFNLTEGQSDIFRVVYEPDILRGAIKTYTQYGKSDVTSMAIITIAMRRKEKILIVSPSMAQSQIIMSNVITHIFDDADITGLIEYEGNLERLRNERSKTRITFKNTGSEIFILTAEATTVSKEARNLMGFGATVIIVDESCLIPDNMFSKILRMAGGIARSKLIQLGNPFDKENHFGRAFSNPRYEKVTVDYIQGIREGRITQEFIDEAREEMSPQDFSIFYETKFPEGGAEDALIPIDWIDEAVDRKGLGGETSQAGLDVARFGRDSSVYCYRKGGNILRLEDKHEMDTMQVVGWVSELISEDHPDTVAVDVIGIGSGVNDRLDELGHNVTPINVGESPSSDDNKAKFANLRAEVFWNLRELFRTAQISIPNDPELKRQLKELKYKYSSERKIQIEHKEDMKKRIGQSPDKADAVALAFYDLSWGKPELMVL